MRPILRIIVRLISLAAILTIVLTSTMADAKYSNLAWICNQPSPILLETSSGALLLSATVPIYTLEQHPIWQPALTIISLTPYPSFNIEIHSVSDTPGVHDTPTLHEVVFDRLPIPVTNGMRQIHISILYGRNRAALLDLNCKRPGSMQMKD